MDLLHQLQFTHDHYDDDDSVNSTPSLDSGASSDDDDSVWQLRL